MVKEASGYTRLVLGLILFDGFPQFRNSHNTFSSKGVVQRRYIRLKTFEPAIELHMLREGALNVIFFLFGFGVLVNGVDVLPGLDLDGLLAGAQVEVNSHLIFRVRLVQVIV